MQKSYLLPIKIFLMLTVLLLVFLNWGSISWVFNYRVIGSLVYDFFHPYENSPLLVAVLDGNQTAAGQNIVVARTATAPSYPYSEKSNSLEIPSIDITAPLIVSQNENLDALIADLDKGAILYPQSAYPGQKGQTIILGHSAPPGWPKIKHDWIFSDLTTLVNGDRVNIFFNNRQYVYEIIGNEILEIGQEISINLEDRENNTLVLVSCWPPGKNYKRIAVRARLLDP